MQRIRRTLSSLLLGGLICALLSGAALIVFALIDGTRTDEAVAYGLIVGVVGAFIGAWIGLAVGIGRLGVLGGAVAGLLSTVGVVAIYLFVNGRPGFYGYFLSESRVFLVVLALPLILTGALTAAIRNRRTRPTADEV
jgi:MFS family permease